MKPVRILVADDHPVVRDGLVGMFSTEDDIEVVAQAADGAEAVRLARECQPDVVLMDLCMPGLDGVAAIERLCEAGRVPRILVVSAYETQRDVRMALAAGADGYLLKDAPRAELVQAVRDLAGGRDAFSARIRGVLTGRSDEAGLTPRERRVLSLVADGLTNRAVASRLGIGEATVKTHLAHTYEKLGVGDRAAAVRVAWERGLV